MRQSLVMVLPCSPFTFVPSFFIYVRHNFLGEIPDPFFYPAFVPVVPTRVKWSSTWG